MKSEQHFFDTKPSLYTAVKIRGLAFLDRTSFITLYACLAFSGIAALSAGGGAMYTLASEYRISTAPPIILDDSMYADAQKARPFSAVTIEARSAIVYDIALDKTLYAKDAETSLPLASLTKLMTALVAYQTLKPDEKITIDDTALSTEGDSGLVSSDIWKFKDLLAFTLIDSSNDGAHAIAAAAGAKLMGHQISEAQTNKDYAAFVDSMNETARYIGLTHTTFNNETGLDVSPRQSGAYGTAHDVAKLLGYVDQHASDALHDTTLTETTFFTALGTYHAINTNQYVGSIPGLVASKTGYTDLAGGNLALLFEVGPGHLIAIVVLGSSREGRFNDVKTLVGATLQSITGL